MEQNQEIYLCRQWVLPETAGQTSREEASQSRNSPFNLQRDDESFWDLLSTILLFSCIPNVMNPEPLKFKSCGFMFDYPVQVKSEPAPLVVTPTHRIRSKSRTWAYLNQT